MAAFDTIIGYIQAAMPELDSQSVSAFVTKLTEAIGKAIDNTEAEFVNTETIITQTITNKNYGHDEYYTDNALAYQEGDDLSKDSFGNFYYAVIDSSKQIIAQAAFEAITTGSSTALVLKVATLNQSTGLLEALTLSQLTAFKSYFLNFEIPGLPISIISNDANVIDFNAAITYDKAYDLTTIQNNVASALLNFRDNFTFNGKFYNYYLENYLVSNVPGVKAVYLSGTTIDGVGFSGYTSLSAGYFDYDAYNLTYNSL